MLSISKKSHEGAAFHPVTPLTLAAVGAVRVGNNNNGINTMYAHTVVSANELQMNLKPALTFAETLKQFCTKDKRAAVLLDIHTEALKNIQQIDTKSPEQVALNCHYLDKIKNTLAGTRQPKPVRPQSIYSVGGAA